MILSTLDINDSTLGQLYDKFQEQRRALGEIYCNVPYPDFTDNGRYSEIAFPAITIASEHIITVTNTVNRFCHDLHSLIYWSKVLGSVSEDDKLMALVEFITPTANQCLSAPSLAKQTLIKSICKISHHTNRFYLKNWSDAFLKADEKLNFHQAKKLALHFGAWPRMEEALSRLYDDGFKDASDDYRNKFNHGFPRRIEYGYSMIIERVEGEPPPYIPNFIRNLESLPNGLQSKIADLNATFKMTEEKQKSLSWYKIVNKPPLYISNLILILAKQYEAAVDCHQAYVELIREQHNIWTSLRCS